MHFILGLTLMDCPGLLSHRTAIVFLLHVANANAKLRLKEGHSILYVTIGIGYCTVPPTILGADSLLVSSS